MVQGHSSDQTQAWCRATPVDQNGASSSLHDPGSGPAPRPKSQKVYQNFKILHETGNRPTKKADFLSFGYSFERRIDLERSQYGP